MAANDCILLTGLVFFGYHGVNPEERKLGQRFVVDLTVRVDLSPAGGSDELTQTINYADLFRLAREVVEGPPVSLLETVAERLARSILAQTPALGVVVRVAKPWAPVKGIAGGEMAVQIQRERRPD